jgi:hypothetical protein
MWWVPFDPEGVSVCSERVQNDFVIIPDDDFPFSNVSTHLLPPGLCMLLINVWRINGKSHLYLPPGLK